MLASRFSAAVAAVVACALVFACAPRGRRRLDTAASAGAASPADPAPPGAHSFRADRVPIVLAAPPGAADLGIVEVVAKDGEAVLRSSLAQLEARAAALGASHMGDLVVTIYDEAAGEPPQDCEPVTEPRPIKRAVVEVRQHGRSTTRTVTDQVEETYTEQVREPRTTYRDETLIAFETTHDAANGQSMTAPVVRARQTPVTEEVVVERQAKRMVPRGTERTEWTYRTTTRRTRVMAQQHDAVFRCGSQRLVPVSTRRALRAVARAYAVASPPARPACDGARATVDPEVLWDAAPQGNALVIGAVESDEAPDMATAIAQAVDRAKSLGAHGLADVRLYVTPRGEVATALAYCYPAPAP